MSAPTVANRSWSLARRLTWWIAAVSIVPMIIAILTGGVFLRSSIARELRALAAEEADEAILRLRTAPDPRAAFLAISDELARDHPDTPFAWRLRQAVTGEVISEFGRPELLACATQQQIDGSGIDGIHRLGHGHVANVFKAPGDLRVLLVVDGQRPHALLSSYWLTAAVVALVCGVLALVASRSLAKRVAGLVRGVADNVRVARETGSEPRVLPTAPDEIRQVTESLRQEMQQVRVESEKVRVFTASLAHELRSPLQNLIGEAEVALLQTRDAKTYATTLANQLAELTDLGDAVDNLLTICTNRPAAPDAVEEFDVAQEARLRLQREFARARRENVRLHFECVGELRMAGDREAVLRGIRNVVANALDWTPAGGEVQVRIEADRKFVRVTVDDTGPGVPIDDRARVFEPFARGGARHRQRIGYGLGLAITKAAAIAHGGSVEVTTAPSGGARFVVAFARRASVAFDGALCDEAARPPLADAKLEPMRI